MNLVEFIRCNNIQCVDGQEFGHSPEFFQIREFARTCHIVRGIPFLDPETYEVGTFDVTLRGSVRERWDRKKKTKKQFFVDRTFRYPDMAEDLESIEDAVPAGNSIDEAIASLGEERERFEFFKRYDLIDTGRYWLNRELQRCIVDRGRVVVIGGDEVNS
mgnify:CR=1 FL=1